MSEPQVTEGEISFDVPSARKACKTWYKVFGDLKNGKTPLILLHGGPGAGHEYLLPFVDLTRELGIPTIFYDQIGCGRSTRFRDRMGDGEFWSVKLFQDQLENLIDHLGLNEKGFDILGQSWGGMLAASLAISVPKGLGKLIIANSPASMDLWVECSNQIIATLPAKEREAIHKYESSGQLDNPEYKEAIIYLYSRHLCRASPWPAPEVKAFMDNLEDDMTTYMTMNGPSELTVTGSLRHWSIIDNLPKIKAPTLVYNGEFDEAQDLCVLPFFKYIPKVKWVVIENTSHFSHVERRERCMKVVGQFLAD